MPSGPEFVIVFVILLLMAAPALIVIAIVRSRPRAQSAASTVVPAWYADPTNRHELRWFDGRAWTAFVCDRGNTAVDPLG